MAENDFLHLFRIKTRGKKNNYECKKEEDFFWKRHKKELIAAKIGVLSKLINAKKGEFGILSNTLTIFGLQNKN
jgi:hypothetical protein